MTKWRNEKGFTAGELLVAIAIIGLVLAAVLTIHQGALQAYLIDSTSAETQQNARIALDRMAREIREAQAIINNGANTIDFTAADGVTAVSYTLNVNTSNLERCSRPVGAACTAATTEILVGGVETLTFVYRDTNDAAGATAANSRRIEITIRTRTEDVVPTGDAIKSEIATSVRLRNAP